MSRTPPKYEIVCGPRCALRPDEIGPEKTKLLLQLKEMGYGIARFQRAAEEILGRKLNPSSTQNHLKHYKELAGAGEGIEDEPEGRRASDVEILDAVIQSAWKNRKAWKPSLRDMLEAMAKKHAITGGSAFEDMMEAMERGLRVAEDGDDLESDVEEAPAAISSDEERAQAALEVE